jgi:hypothetical protein
MRGRGIVVVSLLALFATDAGADPTKPVATWEGRVAPVDGSSGILRYPVGRSGATTIPVPGTTWTCGISAPIVPRAGAERAALACATPAGQSVSVAVECVTGGEAKVAIFQISAPGGTASVIVGIACFPIATPVPVPPSDKSL